jgi:multidrug efflux pump subunit AcrA (membrane-fusion protein)
MKRPYTLIALLILSLVAAGCQASGQPTATPRPQSNYAPVVSVTGELVPAVWATLTHKTGGEVVEVLVEPGDTVANGALLVRLDTGDLELALTTARQEVAAQQALLAQVRNGATDEVIARADRDNAYQVEQAEIALQVKEQQLAQAQAKDPADDVAAAQARIKQIQSQLAQVRAQDPSAEVTLAQVEVERNKIALDDTQNEYNKALDRPWEDQDIRDDWAKQLDQAKLNSRAAQAGLDAANSARRAHALSITVLEAQLEEAQILLAQVEDAQEAYQIMLDILSADINAAEAQIAYLRAWDNPYRDQATEQEIAQIEARLEQARTAVSEIEQQLADATLVAPFDATIGIVDVRAGEMVAPGQRLVTLGDLATMRVETTDLDEIDVVRVSVGQEVAVAFDALPDRVFDGLVARISPMAEPGSGGVHYTVIVELQEMDPVLRWGMTAFVDIETK